MRVGKCKGPFAINGSFLHPLLVSNLRTEINNKYTYTHICAFKNQWESEQKKQTLKMFILPKVVHF
jgi:hypothetical protein